ncbi:MAG TPA: hypothetical protein VLT59_15595 [Steroidobacteraceae bacterium]|nr:hypothetical protein [Steroidobacteraceae bacterium]
MKVKTWLAALLACSAFLTATGPALADGNQPVGTWLLTVSFPPEAGLPPFQELLTLHHNGTVSETNSTLNGNANPLSPLALTGSDGFGAWQRAPDGKVEFSFLKMVFCTQPGVFGCPAANQLVGYLRVRGRAEFRGDVYTGGESVTDLLGGPDPDAPFFVIDFGAAQSVGKRIRVQTPD